ALSSTTVSTTTLSSTALSPTAVSAAAVSPTATLLSAAVPSAALLPAAAPEQQTQRRRDGVPLRHGPPLRGRHGHLDRRALQDHRPGDRVHPADRARGGRADRDLFLGRLRHVPSRRPRVDRDGAR